MSRSLDDGPILGPLPPARHVAEGPAGGFAPTRSAFPRDAILTGRSRQWLGAVPAARVWAACRSLPCGGSVVLTGEAAKCRRSLTSTGRGWHLGPATRHSRLGSSPS